MPNLVDAAAHVAQRRRDALLHHVAELAGVLDVALAGQQHALDGQDLAAHLGPGQAGDDADHVLGLGLAEAELAHAGVLVQVLPGDRRPSWPSW